jgi:hypothetical protein
MKWTPDGVGWFNYSGGVPIFNTQERYALGGVYLDMGSGTDVVDVSLTPRDDLVPIGVLFNYIASAMCNVIVPSGCSDPSTGLVNTSGIPVVSQSPVSVQTIQQDTGGLGVASAGQLVASIDLTQLSATTYEPSPIGMAESFYLSLVNPTWEGEIHLHDQDCPGTVRPGLILNILNGNPAWAGIDAQVQIVRENLTTGETFITVGTPQHLSPQNFVELINMLRRRPLVNDGFAAINTPQQAGGVNCSAGLDPQTKKLLNKVAGSGSSVASAAGLPANIDTCTVGVCEDGMPSTLKVYCPPQ